MADVTPGTARTAASAALRTGSHFCTTVASTVIEKNTLPSLTTTSESLPVSVSATPSGLFTAVRPARTCSLVTAMARLSRSTQGMRGCGLYISPAPVRSTAQTAEGRLTAQPSFAQHQSNSQSRQGGCNGEGRVSGLGRDGVTQGRAPEEQRPTT